MQSSAVAIGLGVAAVGYIGRYVLKNAPNMTSRLNEVLKALPQVDANSKYYKGGFDPKINKREASLILGVSPTASKIKIKVSALSSFMTGYRNHSNHYFTFMCTIPEYAEVLLLTHCLLLTILRVASR